MTVTVQENLLRSIFGFLDRGIYWAIEIIMQLIMDLANFRIFNDSVIHNFASRIYVILGLVMLFKIMISFIQILINPEKMEDNEQGVGGVLKRVVISLALIYLVPSIFDLARQVQTQIIPIIPKVILGSEVSLDPEDENAQEAMASTGRMMAFYTFTPFFTYANANCRDGTIMGTGDDNNATIWSVATAVEAREAECETTGYSGYKYEYNWPWSTIVGIYVAYVLVTVAVAVAIRTLKFAICEFIAPIPIASYIDPKTSGQAFNGWVKSSTSTYLDLFIRLIIVYFIIFVFQSFLNTDNINYIRDQLDGNLLRSGLVIVFVIVGLLQFAKQAPKFIGDMLGFQGTGDMLKGMLTGEGFRQIGSSIGGLAGMAAAPVSSMLSNYNYSRNVKKESRATAIRRAIAGFGSGAARATASAFNGGGWSGARSVRDKVTATSRHRANIATTRRKARESYNENMGKYNVAQENLSALRSQVASRTRDLNASVAQGKSSWEQYIAAKKRGDTRMANVHHANYQNQVAKQQRIQKDIDDLNSQIDINSKVERPVRSPAYGIGRAQTAVGHFTGRPLPDSNSYSAAASLMMKGKGIFNEAKSKVTEAPTLITDSLTFKNKSGTTFGSGTFSQIYSALNEAKATGQQVTLNGQRLTAGQLEDIYGEALKTTAERYVNYVANGRISNDTMYTDIQMFGESSRDDLVLEKSDSDAVNAFNINSPGAFLKSADTLGKNFEQKAAQYKRNELPKE